MRGGNYKIVNRFWKAELVNVNNNYGDSYLHIACEVGFASIVEGIILRGGDVKKKNHLDLTPLMIAVDKGHLRVIQKLLDYNCDVNAASTSYGVTPIYTAAARGRMDIVELLLQVGSDVNRRDIDNVSPLMIAILSKRWDIVWILLRKPSDLSQRDSQNATLMDYALLSKAPDDIIDYLEDAGVRTATPKLKSQGYSGGNYGKQRVDWVIFENYKREASEFHRSEIARNTAQLEQLEKGERDI